MRLPLQLVNLLKEEDVYQEFLQGFKGYAYVREPIVKLLKIRIKELELDYDKPDVYQSPNLSELEADNRGMRRAFREMIQLLSEGLDDGES